jgi:hypothetical protein
VETLHPPAPSAASGKPVGDAEYAHEHESRGETARVRPERDTPWALSATAATPQSR